MKPTWISLSIIALGIFLLGYSSTLPYYTDGHRIEELQINADGDNSGYYKIEKELRTPKRRLLDFGSGLVVAGTFVFLFLITRQITSFKHLSEIESTSTMDSFIGANYAWLLMIPGTIWYYYFRGMRGDFPSFADTIAIPIMTQIPVLLFFLIPLNLFLAVITWRANDEAKIFAGVRHNSVKSVLLEIFFDFWILVSAAILCLSVWDGDHFAIVTNLYFVFLFLSIRARQMTPHEAQEYSYQKEEGRK